MIRRGDRVFVALSGGADSVALLHILYTLRIQMGFSLHALHLNHRLRGTESRRDERFVRSLCASLDIPLTVDSAPVRSLARRRGLSVEDCARRVRYAFFRRHAGAPGDKVATAHTASDNAETVLLNLIRGTGLRGLCGIPPVRGNIIRPLIGCTRAQVEAYCAGYGLAYVTDSTNRSDEHTRNRLRHHVVPLLLRENPRFEERVSDMAQMLRADADYLDREALGALEHAAASERLYSRGTLLALPAVLRLRTLRLLLQREGLRYDRGRLRLMEEILRTGGGVQLSGRWTLRCRGDIFSLEEPPAFGRRKAPAGAHSVQIYVPPLGQTVQAGLFPGKKLRFYLINIDKCEETIKYPEKLLKNALDCDRIERILNLRCARPSDKIRPVGRGCTKTMKNIWGENHLSVPLRREQLLLEAAGRTLWAEGVGADEHCAVTRDTTCIFAIELLEED